MSEKNMDDDAKVENEKNMSFLEHLADLRKVLVRSVIAITVCALPFLMFYKQGLEVYARLLPSGADLIVLSPIEMYMTILKIAFFFSLFLSLPYVLYQIWWFIGPGFYKREKNIVLPFVFSGSLCFLVGVLFCYFVVLPFSIKVLWDFGNVSYNTSSKPPVSNVAEPPSNEGVHVPTDAEEKALPEKRIDTPTSPENGSSIHSQWRTSTFYNFCVWTSFGFGVGFNLPVVLVGLSMMGIITADWLSKYRVYAIVLCGIVAAVLTPSDVFSMFLLMVPLYLLYEISIITIRIIDRRRAKKETLS